MLESFKEHTEGLDKGEFVIRYHICSLKMLELWLHFMYCKNVDLFIVYTLDYYLILIMNEAVRRIEEWRQLNDPTECLDLSNLGLTELPPIPDNCQVLYCHNNQLTDLPKLDKCQYLYCCDNKYLHVTKKLAKRFNLKETPNYSKYAGIIERTYRRFKQRRICNEINHLFIKDVCTMVSFYVL